MAFTKGNIKTNIPRNINDKISGKQPIDFDSTTVSIFKSSQPHFAHLFLYVSSHLLFELIIFDAGIPVSLPHTGQN